MHLYITAENFEVDEALREHVLIHLVDAVQRHAVPHRLNRIEVRLSLGERDARYRCRVLTELDGQRDIVITAENRDLYMAIGLAKKRVLKAVVAARKRALEKPRYPRELWRKLTQLLCRA